MASVKRSNLKKITLRTKVNNLPGYIQCKFFTAEEKKAAVSPLSKKKENLKNRLMGHFAYCICVFAFLFGALHLVHNSSVSRRHTVYCNILLLTSLFRNNVNNVLNFFFPKKYFSYFIMGDIV